MNVTNQPTNQPTSSSSKPLALDLCCGKGGWTNGLLESGWDVIGVDVEDMGGYTGKLLLHDVRTLTKEILDKFQMKTFGFIRPIKLVVASPPCQEFSYSALPFKKARSKFSKENPPDESIWRACEKIAKLLYVPLILENVRGAKKWMGPSTWHYGSFYFWGELPALIPIGCPRKGFGRVKTLSNPSDKYGGFGGQNEGVKKQRIVGGDRKSNFGWNKPEVQDQRRRPKNFMPGEYERKLPINHRGPDMSVQRDNHKKIHGAEQAGRHGSSLRKQWSATIAMIPLEISTWIGNIFFPKEG